VRNGPPRSARSRVGYAVGALASEEGADRSLAARYGGVRGDSGPVVDEVGSGIHVEADRGKSGHRRKASDHRPCEFCYDRATNLRRTDSNSPERGSCLGTTYQEVTSGEFSGVGSPVDEALRRLTARPDGIPRISGRGGRPVPSPPSSLAMGGRTTLAVQIGPWVLRHAEGREISSIPAACAQG